MIEIPVLLKATDSVLGWFGFLRKERKEKSERERQALKALYLALIETSMYFRRLDRPYLAKNKKEEKVGFQRNIQTEEALARLWTEASVELRDVEPELAQRCFFKGQFWADRDAWTQDDIRKADIVLEKLRRDAQFLLQEQ